jgi:hypothetical protein
MSGQVIGAFSTTATRMSVILRSDGIELRCTLAGAASMSASVSRPNAETPAAALPIDVKNERRSSRRSTAGFMAPLSDPRWVPEDGVSRQPRRRWDW